MSQIAWHLLNPVDVGGQVQQGFQTGMAMVKTVQRNNALRAYMDAPDDRNAYGALAMFDPQAAESIRATNLREQEALREQQTRGRHVALGELYNADPEGAVQEAIGAGDFDLAAKFRDLSEAQQKKTADFWGQAGTVAYTLRQEPDPQKRIAIWQQARPMLEAQGAPVELLDRFDPTNDAQLSAAIATSAKISELAPKAFNVGPGEGRYEVDPLTGQIVTVIAPNPGGQPFGAPAGGGAIPPPPPGFTIVDDGGPTPSASGNFPG